MADEAGIATRAEDAPTVEPATEAEAVRAIVWTLLPSPVLARAPELDRIVRRVRARREAMGPLGRILPAVAAFGRLVPGTPGFPLERLEGIVSTWLQGRGAHEAVAHIYQIIAGERGLFERLLGRRLTAGNEPCPYWDTYDQPPPPLGE